jgi:hypothetical protein
MFTRRVFLVDCSRVVGQSMKKYVHKETNVVRVFLVDCSRVVGQELRKFVESIRYIIIFGFENHG